MTTGEENLTYRGPQRLSTVQRLLVCFNLLLIIALIGAGFYPLNTRHFLLAASYSAFLSPLRLLVAITLAITFFLALRALARVYLSGEKLMSLAGEVKLLVFLVWAPVAGFYVGWQAMTNVLPALQHHFAEHEDVELPFTITGRLILDQHCGGVTAINPAFEGDSLCDVEIPGPIIDWVRRTVFVSGQQSEFGFTYEEYRF